MAVNVVSSNNVPAAPPARQSEAKPVIDRPSEKAAQAAQAAKAVQAPAPAAAPPPKPVVNTSGQTTGTTINTSA